MRLHRRKYLAIGLVLFLLVAITSCKEAESGKKLAAQGVVAADALASYYDQLAQDTLDTLELEAFLSVTRKVEFRQDSQKLLELRYEALQRRAKLARSLKETYSAFLNLSSYDASKEINASAESLGESLKSIPPLPASGVDASKIVAGAANKIAEWKQSRDLQKANSLMIESLASFTELFSRESETYKAITEERGNKIANVITYLIKQKKVDATSLLDRVPKALGLSLSSSGPASDEMLDGLATMATVKERRLSIASAQTCDDLQQSLELLKKAHESFKSGGEPALSDVAKMIEKARTALSSISQARASVGGGNQ